MGGKQAAHSSKATQEAIRKQIEKVREAEEETSKWKAASTLYAEAMTSMTKQAKENRLRLEALEKRELCREFEKNGRCSRVPCRFAHRLPATAAVMEKQNANSGVLDGFGSIAPKAQVKVPLAEQDCPHYMAGYCKFFNNCRRKHDATKYGTTAANSDQNSRPRSRSAGSNEPGFHKPSRKHQGNLGVVHEEQPLNLPEVSNPQTNEETMAEEIRMLDDMAKNFPAAEKAQLERIKELRVSAMLGARDWREMLAAFRNKSGV